MRELQYEAERGCEDDFDTDYHDGESDLARGSHELQAEEVTFGNEDILLILQDASRYQERLEGRTVPRHVARSSA